MLGHQVREQAHHLMHSAPAASSWFEALLSRAAKRYVTPNSLRHIPTDCRESQLRSELAAGRWQELIRPLPDYPINLPV